MYSKQTREILNPQKVIAGTGLSPTNSGLLLNTLQQGWLRGEELYCRPISASEGKILFCIIKGTQSTVGTNLIELFFAEVYYDGEISSQSLII